MSMAPKKKQDAYDAGATNKRARLGSPPPSKRKPALNSLDCNLDFTVESDGITGSALCNEGFAYCWSGARATFGVKGGKYCFGCRVIENQQVIMEDTAKDQQNLCRVGLSRGDSDVGSLGESSTSFGYGGTGKFSHGGDFTGYGGVFGVGDIIMCAVDLDNPSRAKVSFAKNGKWLGVAVEFDAGPRGLDIVGALDHNKAIFPHILLKNVKVRMLLSIDHGLQPLEGFKPWDAAVNDGNAVEGPQATKDSDCEVIMMVGLPGSGKTTWAQKWVREHAEERYVLLGTNAALDQMKVPGLLRKRNYGERFERLMDRATKIFNQLMDRASKASRNIIIDQTNVYRSARIRKLKPFRNFQKIAVVVFPHPEELRRRTCARAQEMGKEVPEDAVREMLKNFVLPNSKEMLNSVEPFDEVRFTELQRGDAERYLAEMKSDSPIKSFRNSSFERYQTAPQDSKCLEQGGYSSNAYRLQDLRKSPHLPVPSPLSQVPYAQVPYSSTSQPHERSRYRSPYEPSSSYLQGLPNLQGRQTSYSNQSHGEDSVSCYGGYQENFLGPDGYARETCVNSFSSHHNFYSPRDSSIPSRYGFHSNPSQESYGPSSRVAGCDNPAQILHSTPSAGAYAGIVARNNSRPYGDSHLPSSRAGQSSYRRFTM
ncbi:hypothetical protein GOP47_0025443 [Adiantum capillus-veneris]|uniref:SPRY domain-containing protein n=1 Tax=Adiantum capillus-veneris TaxID=13818 RepID=A0A9D4Z300_ADICA|nr:hypothetical protein GOP47_0025443 [Adiantum capillus-veneris]